MNLARKLFGPGKDETWSQLSAEIGGEVVRASRGNLAVQARCGHWIVTLDTWTMNRTMRTRLRAPFVNWSGFRFSLMHDHSFSVLGLRRLFGSRDIQIGEPAFDDRFALAGNNPGRARALFTNPRILDLVLAQPAMDLRINDDEGALIASECPRGVDVLQFQADGVLLDVSLLKGLFQLFSEMLLQLASASPSPEALDLQAQRAAALRTSRRKGPALSEAERRHLAVLQAPGGQLREFGILLWDGDPPRREAALALGELKSHAAAPRLREALTDGDPGLRVAALQALGAIGDRSAAPEIIPLMGDGAPWEEQPVWHGAVEALEKLGEGEFTTAFLDAMEGRPEAVELLRHQPRATLISALRGALEDPVVTRASRAAWVLGELGEESALQRIGERYWELMRVADPKQTRLIAEAAEKLSRHAALPRPAQAPLVDTSQLPRPIE